MNSTVATKNKAYYPNMVKDEVAVENIKIASRIGNKAIELASSMCFAGTRANVIDKEVHSFLLNSGAYPANLEVKDYNYATCISVGSEIAHGIPSLNKVLHNGDIVCIDVGVKYKNYYADCARTTIVRSSKTSVDRKDIDMIIVCKSSLEKAIKNLKAGSLLSEYGRRVNEYVNEGGFNVVKFLTGHGTGYKYHEEPNIYNFYHPHNDIVLEKNTVLSFELMITDGIDKYKKEEDGWTLCTVDGSHAVHFEHTVLIKENEAEILDI